MRNTKFLDVIPSLIFLVFAVHVGYSQNQYARRIPFNVIYDLGKDSDIKNPKLIRIQYVKIFREKKDSRFYIGIINKNTEPVSLMGIITFFDEMGNFIFKQGRPGEFDEFYGQADPGFSEGSDAGSGFESVDLTKIYRVEIRIQAANIDVADRD